MKAPVVPHSLPSEFRRFFDEWVPNWVKQNYSPKEAWKKTPFFEKDAEFFSRGIEELSFKFTEERGQYSKKVLKPYFQHERFRSAYLLYFMVLHAAKFCTLLERHGAALRKNLKLDSRKSLKILDLGSGPGTASISVLLWLRDQGYKGKIELEWWDTQKGILYEGRNLILHWAQKNEWIDQIDIQVHVGDWQKRDPRKSSDLILIGNLLNEISTPEGRLFSLLHSFWKSSGAGGLLILEPAAPSIFERLLKLRTAFIDEQSNLSLYGPCLHLQKCPLAEGRDWCHFSFPSLPLGKWFDFFSRALGSERRWLKFCYLWIAGPGVSAPHIPKIQRLVISDPLRERDGKTTVLLCEPERPFRYTRPDAVNHYRGKLINMTS